MSFHFDPTSYGHVETPPEDGASAFSLRKDEGYRFAAPFRAIVWDNSAPLKDDPKNWTTVDVVTMEDDMLHYTSPADITIQGDMRVASLFSIDEYDLEEQVRLDAVSYDTVEGITPLGSEFGGSVPFFITPLEPGVYSYRFEGATGAGPDKAFYVRYTDAQL